MIQSERIPGLVPPRLWSRFKRSNAPGAPVFPSGSVVSFAEPKQGQLVVPFRSGWSLLTTIGATQRAWVGASTRAVAFEPTLIELTPKMRVKIPGAGRFRLTVIVSLGPNEFDRLTEASPPPFLPRYSFAKPVALAAL